MRLLQNLRRSAEASFYMPLSFFCVCQNNELSNTIFIIPTTIIRTILNTTPLFLFCLRFLIGDFSLTYAISGLLFL